LFYSYLFDNFTREDEKYSDVFLINKERDGWINFNKQNDLNLTKYSLKSFGWHSSWKNMESN